MVLVLPFTGLFHINYHSSSSFFSVYAVVSKPQSNKAPIINDPNLKVQIVFKGIAYPTSMAFLGPDDILVLEKNTGLVKRIVNGRMLPEPLLDVNVANQNERGMLGIGVAPKHQNNNNNNAPRYVFLYYTEAAVEGEDECPKPNHCNPGHEPLGNRLYRYELVDNNTKLINPKLLLDLPAGPAAFHNGGKVTIGPDNNVYFVIGDKDYRSKTQNIPNNPDSNGTSAIYRITQNGKAVGKGIISHKNPLNKYYAYGIRNSFGIDFDPVTKKLWDTENGPTYGDEINLVKPGFNSGWIAVQGIWKRLHDRTFVNVTGTPKGLVDFNGTGKYSPPEFTWRKPIGVTAIQFLNSDKLGKLYKNDMFVGDFHNGYLYHFDLNKNRTGLVLNNLLSDKVANSPNELKNGRIIFGKGFGGITDMQVGPDGYLYVLSLYQGGNDCGAETNSSGCVAYSSALPGTVFRIVPARIAEEEGGTIQAEQQQLQNSSIANKSNNNDDNNNNNNQSQQQQKKLTMFNNSTPSESTNKISIVQGAYIMTDNAFSPNPGTVKVGDTVTWTNDDDQPHTVTSGNGPDDPNKGKAFDSGPSALANNGKTFHHKFTQAGQYPYFCELHPTMVGKIIVS
jgi:glucose/arabinose dehydrogenase/plastocyanin